MSQTFPTEFEGRLAAAWPVGDWQNVRVALAVSGGPDSVALARAMVRLAAAAGGGRLWLAHFNHKLRGADSDADEQFVRELADCLGVECLVGHAQPGSLDRQPDGLEAAARNARHAFFRDAAEALGARYVVTAHTSDDQAETMLQRIVRGTGLAGLAGIPRTRLLSPAVTLLRPMLELGRDDVLAYLQALDQPSRVDDSNFSRQFTRARIRHELLPLLAREFNPTVVAALTRLGKLAGEAQAIIEREAETVLDAAWVKTPEVGESQREQGQSRGICLNCDAFRGVERHLAREVFALAWRRRGWPLQQMGFAEWEQLAELAIGDRSESREGIAREFPGGIRAVRAVAEIILTEPKR
jgi:tRNA(Ile)-lysidine synthase